MEDLSAKERYMIHEALKTYAVVMRSHLHGAGNALGLMDAHAIKAKLLEIQRFEELSHRFEVLPEAWIAVIAGRSEK